MGIFSSRGKKHLDGHKDLTHHDPSLPIKFQHFVNRTTFYIFNI